MRHRESGARLGGANVNLAVLATRREIGELTGNWLGVDFGGFEGRVGGA